MANRNKTKKKEKKAYGLIDRVINKMPEIHIPGYQYCGPGTELQKRLARGDPGINKLDEACKKHDIAYDSIQDSKERRRADKKLIGQAFRRVYSRDANMNERLAALLVSGVMGAKMGLTKIGLGLKNNNKRKRVNNMTRKKRLTLKKKTLKRKRILNARNSISFNKLVRKADTAIAESERKLESNHDNLLAGFRKVSKMGRGKTIIKCPRVLELPEYGAGLISRLTALSAAGVFPRTSRAVKKAFERIGDVMRHQRYRNFDQKDLPDLKVARGLYLSYKPNVQGSGFYLKPYYKGQKNK